MAVQDHVASARSVYDASADQYVQFVGTAISSDTEAPADQALLNTFVDLVGNAPRRRVADVGCGPGRVAAFVASRDVDVVGLDVSAAILKAARDAHPDIGFVQGQIDRLPFERASLAGVVCWYSVIYTPPEYLVDAFTEIKRVLGAGGYVLLAFQAGNGDRSVRTDAHGSGFSLTSFRHSVGDMTSGLERSGLVVQATALRAPEFDHETTPQAFVMARSTPY